MDKALYRKYRSKTLDELVGQEHISRTLKNSLKKGQLSHAYLFSGPRGVGKTSVARILAREANGLKDSGEEINLDIIEIDAASNRRIEEIRDLREKVHIAPASAKYKVYIIDEAHMLTKEAFNALLKTLEEPPAHCIFILATTEPHKLPETIISRTQHFSFKPIDQKQVAEHLKSIAKKEGIKIDDEALSELAEHSDGSFRDAINMLDQLRHYDSKISADQVQSMLGVPPKIQIDELYSHLQARQLDKALDVLQKLRLDGYQPVLIARRLYQKSKLELLNTGPDQKNLLNFAQKLLKTASSNEPMEYLELVCLEFATTITAAKGEPKTVLPSESLTSKTDKPTETPEDKQVFVENRQAKMFSIQSWPDILMRVKTLAPSLYTALRMAETKWQNDILKLRFGFNLHYKKATSSAHKAVLVEAFNSASIKAPKIDYELDKSVLPDPDLSSLVEDSQPTISQTATEPKLDAINSIFGGSEVLEV